MEATYLLHSFYCYDMSAFVAHVTEPSLATNNFNFFPAAQTIQQNIPKPQWMEYKPWDKYLNNTDLMISQNGTMVFTPALKDKGKVGRFSYLWNGSSSLWKQVLHFSVLKLLNKYNRVISKIKYSFFFVMQKTQIFAVFKMFTMF